MKFKNDTTHRLTETYISDEYDKFSLLEGNRKLEPRHVQRLIQQIEMRGNLTDQFPIVVNKKHQILDGQHRFTALKHLGEPIVYVIKDSVGIDDIRNINTTHRNWTWIDYARSFADLGEETYQRIVSLYEEFGYGYGITLVYTGGVEDRARGTGFYTGDYQKFDFKKVRSLMRKLKTIQQMTGNVSRPLAIALKDIFKAPNYDHERMLRKLKKYGDALENAHNIKDYRRTLEDIYNKGQRADTIERLF